MQREFKISLSQEFYSDIVYLSQYDSDYPVIFTVTDKYSKASGINGYTAKFTGTRGDGTGLGFTYTATAIGHTVSFTIDTMLTGVAGTHAGEIIFYDQNGLYFGTANVQIIVEPAARPDGTIDADEEELRDLAQQCQDIVDTAAAEVKGEAEAWAVGQRDGVDVPSTDPAYENNAKFYAEQAQDIADSIGIDATLSISGKAADAKKTGDEISSLKEDLSVFRPTATSEDVGKALIVKTVEDGVPTEFEYGDAGGDISAFTDSVKEWLKGSDAVGGYWYNSADAPTSTSPNNRCYFDVEIPVTAGTTYYYKDIIGSKSWVKYSGSNARIKNVVNNDLYSGTFTPSADGTVVCSGYLDHKTTAIWTDDESIYNAGLQEDKLILKTDSTLTSETIPANAKATGEAIEGAKTYADSAVASVIDSQENSFFDESYGKCSVNTTAHTVTQSASGNMHGSGLFRIFPFVTYYTNNTWSIPHCYVYDKDMQFICTLGDDTGKVVTVSHVTTKYRMFTVLDPDAYYCILTTAESGWDYEKDFFIKVFSDADSVVDFGTENSEAVKYRLCGSSPYFYGKKWAVLGDSITAGDGLTTNILTRYSSVVAKQCGIIPYNYGYSGSRIAVEGSAGDSTYDNAMVIRYASMIADADYITVLGGINDANNQLPLGTLGDTDISTFYGALEVLITGLLTKYPGKAIGFITFPHYGGGTGHQTYVNAIKEACARYAIPVLDLHSNGGMNTMTTAFSQMFYSDGLHPNELGQSVMARKICAFLGTL